MLCLAVFSSMWAEEVTFTAGTDVNPAAAGKVSLTKDGITLALSNGQLNNRKYYGIYRNSKITISSAQGNITKIVFNCTASGTAQYGPGCLSGTEGYSYEGKVGTWTGNSLSITLSTSANQVRATSIVVTYATNANFVAVPTFTGQENFLHQQTITIAGPANSTIYYGIDLSAEDSSDADGKYTGKGEEGTGVAQLDLDATHTIIAFAKIGENKSANVSKTFTCHESVDKTIADLHGMTTDQAFINLRLTNAKVVYVDAKNVYIREGDKAVLFYGTGLNLPLNSTLNGSLICDYDYRNKLIEVRDNSATNLDHVTVTGATTTALDPSVTTVGDILQFNKVSDLVRLNSVTITVEGEGTSAKYYATSGESKVRLYGHLEAVKGIASDGNTYDLIAGFNNIYIGAAHLKPFALAIPVAVGETRYATLYYSKLALTIPEDATASTYKVTNGRLETSKSYEAGKNISAGTAVVIKAEPGNYEFLSTTNTGNSDNDSMLSGTDTETALEADATSYFYRLSTNETGDMGSVGFYWGTEDGSAFTNGAHKAYLKVAKDAADGAKAYPFSNDPTGIGTLKTTEKAGNDAIYNLAGQQVGDTYKGIVIVNGKKVIKK